MNITPATNTDNKINRFVTVFANRPCTQDRFVITCIATAPVPASNFVTGDKFAAPINLVGDTPNAQ
jgi:hypothetical protein